MTSMSMDELKQGIKECDDELEQETKKLIALLNVTSIEYIDFYAVINKVDNITRKKNKLENMLTLEL